MIQFNCFLGCNLVFSPPFCPFETAIKGAFLFTYHLDFPKICLIITVMVVIDLGMKNFSLAYQSQRFYLKKREKGEIDDLLILVEHPPVITLGRNGRMENLLIPKERLKELGIEFYKIERGGDITFHSPGQLVGYLIFYLKEALAGIKKFIYQIEEALIETLRGIGIPAERKEKFIGVWVKEKKIASIGLAIERWITYHGFALNVNNDLSYFTLLNPCGLKGVEMTSVAKELNREVPLSIVKKEIEKSFLKVFSNNG